MVLLVVKIKLYNYFDKAVDNFLFSKLLKGNIIVYNMTKKVKKG